MNTCRWEEVNAFHSLTEFNRFVDWMTAQTKSGAAEEVAVRAPYISSATFRDGDPYRLGRLQVVLLSGFRLQPEDPPHSC
jgi:hypothetical protein